MLSLIVQVLLQDVDLSIQMQAVQQEIDYVKAQQERNEQDLTIAEQAADEARVGFLRKCLEQLNRQLSSLREKENILLQGQASGQHCLPCYILPPLGWVACTRLFVCVRKAPDHMEFC